VKDKIEEFAAALTAKFGGKEHGTDHFAVEFGGKFARVIAVNAWGQRSAYAFVAMEDGANKQLGSWSQGDVFKPAGWKGPAKHARGNVLSHLGGLEYCGEHGVAYMR